MDYDLKKLFNLKLEKSIECNASQLAFQHAIKIYINKPQVINKWVAGSVVNTDLSIDEIVFNDVKIKDFIKNGSVYTLEIREFISKSSKIFENLKYLIINDSNYENFIFYPLNSQLTDKKYSSISFCHSYQYDQNQKKLNLFISDEQNIEATRTKNILQIKWLSENLLSKLQNWCLNVKSNSYSNCAKLNTLTLYDDMIEDYMNLYQELKEIYWSRFSNTWFELTNTNPEKYIHEDVSIATYLILMWKHLKYKVKCFVDMGCGNGLLVYILNDQGINGYGIDMRKRKIWENDFYMKSNVKLLEETIDPRSCVFENVDWLIGNHSDELSPWLPVIALKSSKHIKCNFFLIPCCFFDFTCKYDVKKPNESRYDTYLKFLTEIIQVCGFNVYRDKLRIPSTRNVCFICNLTDEKDVDLHVNSALKQKVLSIIEDTNNLEKFNVDFKARDLDLEKAKSTRNCTKNVDLELKNYIIKKVLDTLLTDTNAIKCTYLKKEDGSNWNAGVILALSDAAKLFDKEILNKLKLECGGIKTLLKNHYQMFQIIDKDKVKLKIWETVKTEQDLNFEIDPDINSRTHEQARKPDNKCLKTKACLFDLYHPDGCLLNDISCSYIHNKR